MEEHHLLGKANDAKTTIGVPGNLHRILSELQREWPAEVRHNQHADPLLWLAGACLSLHDQLSIWVTWLSHVALWLISAAQGLQAQHGSAWWQALGIPQLWEGGQA